MAKLRSHQLDVYGAWLHVATDAKAYRKLRRLLPSLDKDPGGMGAVSITLHESDESKTVAHLSVWLDVAAAEDTVDLVNLVAHEATHAGTALLDHIGQAYDAESEALAYLVGFIAGWLWEACT